MTACICIYMLLLLFCHYVVPDSLRPHGLQHSRLPCPPPSPKLFSNSCPLSRWCHPTISSSAVPFSFAFSLSQHQGLLQWVSSSHQEVLELPLQHQSFQWIFRTDFLYSWLVWSPCCLNRVFSRTTIWKHQFFGAQPSLWSSSHICIWLLEKP